MKYKITLSTLLFSLFTQLTISQDFNFKIHETSLQDYIQRETQIGSQKIPTTSNHVSFSGEGQPIKFRRKEEIIPDLVAEYFFKKKDSTMTKILYEWDISNFEKQDNNTKSEEFQKALMAKYESIKNQITEQFGEPKTRNNYSNIARLDPENIFEENSSWQPNDSTEIEIYTTVSNYYEKKGNVTVNPVHRIRLYIRNTKKEKPKVPKLENERIDSLEHIKEEFLMGLKIKKLNQVKRTLSEQLVNKVTDEQLLGLLDYIDPDQDTELIYSGIKMNLTGQAYVILQYKNVSEESKVTSTMVQYIFDEKNKIIGVKPMQVLNDGSN